MSRGPPSVGGEVVTHKRRVHEHKCALTMHYQLAYDFIVFVLDTRSCPGSHL
jgi:hypothetical protein